MGDSLKFAKKTGIFGPQTLFLAHVILYLAILGPFKSLFGPYLTLFNAETPFLPLVSEIFVGSNLADPR